MFNFDHSKKNSLEACGITEDQIKNEISKYTTVGEIWKAIQDKDDTLLRCVSYITAVKLAESLSHVTASPKCNIFLLVCAEFISSRVFSMKNGILLSQITEVVYDFITNKLENESSDSKEVIKFLIFMVFSGELDGMTPEQITKDDIN